MADPTGNDLSMTAVTTEISQGFGLHSTDHPLLNLTAEEKRVFSQLFQQADTERLGVVTGEIAVKFFEKTKVSPPVLGEVCSSNSLCLISWRINCSHKSTTDMADSRYREPGLVDETRVLCRPPTYRSLPGWERAHARASFQMYVATNLGPMTR